MSYETEELIVSVEMSQIFHVVQNIVPNYAKIF